MNKLKTRFLIAACSLILMALPGAPARAIARQSETNAFAPPNSAVVVQRARRYGPYATLRRANEVANYARRQHPDVMEEQVRSQPWFVKAMGNPMVMGALGVIASKLLRR